MKNTDRARIAKKITLIGGIVNALLSLIKILGGFLFHSQALVADGFHSIADLLSDAISFWISHYSSHAADKEHPYGHQRLETAGTLFISLMLIIAGSGIIFDAFHLMILHSMPISSKPALMIALLTVIINEGLFRYMLRFGEKIESDLIIANAWHHRADAASSLVVLIGLIGTYWGFFILDHIAAIIVGIMIIKMGSSYCWNAVNELVDSSIDPALLKQMESLISKIDGVKSTHLLRTRMMGKAIFIDLHVEVCSLISVSEGHYIAHQVEYELTKSFKEIKDVTIHIDCEDDEFNKNPDYLPSRKTVEQRMLLPLQSQFPSIQRWNFHYLHDQLRIELICHQETDWSLMFHKLEEELSRNKAQISIQILVQEQLLS